MTSSTIISSINITSVLCLGLAMVFVGGWYFQSSLIELQAQQETTQIVQQLKEK